MASGTQDSPPPRDNFSERLHDNCVTETKLTLLNYAHIENLKIRKISCPSFSYSYIVFKYSYGAVICSLNKKVFYSIRQCPLTIVKILARKSFSKRTQVIYISPQNFAFLL